MAKAVFNWEDPFMLDQQLADDERMVMDSARKFASDVADATGHCRLPRREL